METVLDTYSLVGGSRHLVASFSLVHLHVDKQGPFTSRNRPTDSLGDIYLDVDRIHSSPVPFPHKDQELLVRYTHTLYFLYMSHFMYIVLMLMLLWNHFRGNTAHYLLHGCHHKHPMDHLRLVFPPAATAVLCFPVSI